MTLLPIQIEPGHSSYFSQPQAELDPKLFVGGRIRPEVRQHLLQTLYDFWRPRYASAEQWSKVWIAGSAVSYQWHGDRGIADLDVLIGVNFNTFFRDNPSCAMLSEETMAERFNIEFFQQLNPQTANWEGFEVTWYVNPHAADIRDIQPYAAYNLTDDRFSVPPTQLPRNWNPRTFFPAPWWSTVNREIGRVKQMLQTYNNGSADVVRDLLSEYDVIHSRRKEAFRPGGQGYIGFGNFAWQAHKMAGTEQALRALRDHFAV